VNSKNDFLKQLDQMDNEGKLEKNPDRLINWHKARATICLYDEAYQLRLALNRTAEAINKASEDVSTKFSSALTQATLAINNASTESTRLGSKIWWLTLVLAIIAFLGIGISGIRLYMDFQEFSYNKLSTNMSGSIKTIQPIKPNLSGR
jgi:hypothetical protein